MSTTICGKRHSRGRRSPVRRVTWPGSGRRRRGDPGDRRTSPRRRMGTDSKRPVGEGRRPRGDASGRCSAARSVVPGLDLPGSPSITGRHRAGRPGALLRDPSVATRSGNDSARRGAPSDRPSPSTVRAPAARRELLDTRGAGAGLEGRCVEVRAAHDRRLVRAPLRRDRELGGQGSDGRGRQRRLGRVVRAPPGMNPGWSQSHPLRATASNTHRHNREPTPAHRAVPSKSPGTVLRGSSGHTGACPR